MRGPAYAVALKDLPWKATDEAEILLLRFDEVRLLSFGAERVNDDTGDDGNHDQDDQQVVCDLPKITHEDDKIP